MVPFRDHRASHMTHSMKLKQNLPVLPYHCNESIVSPGRAAGLLVVTVSLSPIACCAKLAAVVVIPGGVIFEE